MRSKDKRALIESVRFIKKIEDEIFTTRVLQKYKTKSGDERLNQFEAEVRQIQFLQFFLIVMGISIWSILSNQNSQRSMQLT